MLCFAVSHRFFFLSVKVFWMVKLQLISTDHSPLENVNWILLFRGTERSLKLFKAILLVSSAGKILHVCVYIHVYIYIYKIPIISYLHCSLNFECEKSLCSPISVLKVFPHER